MRDVVSDYKHRCAVPGRALEGQAPTAIFFPSLLVQLQQSCRDSQRPLQMTNGRRGVSVLKLNQLWQNLAERQKFEKILLTTLSRPE